MIAVIAFISRLKTIYAGNVCDCFKLSENKKKSLSEVEEDSTIRIL